MNSNYATRVLPLIRRGCQSDFKEVSNHFFNCVFAIEHDLVKCPLGLGLPRKSGDAQQLYVIEDGYSDFPLRVKRADGCWSENTFHASGVV